MSLALHGLVGRDPELATFDALIAALVAGTGGACVVAGPAGIGKTALVTAVLDRAERSGARVLRARGSELEGALSFGAVRDLLGPSVHRLPPPEQDALLAGPAAFARPVLGLGGRAGSGAGSGAGEAGDPLYGLFWLTVALAEQQPLLLAIDDLHWLDQESARFGAYLARRVEGLPILLVATAQTHVQGPAAEPMADLLESAQAVELAPLTRAAVGDLVPGRPAAEVHRLTGGNPMLAVELARALEAEPAAEPESVSMRGVGAGILRRIRQVSPEAVALARAVALSPRRLGLHDASALADLDEHDAVAAADALVRAQVLEWDGERLGFLHPLMRTAVYDDLEPVGRRAAHDRAAAVLADRGADAETVAAQLLAAEPHGSDDNVRILVEAADEAEARLAPRAVATYLRRAVTEPPTDKRELARLQHRLGRVLLDLGSSEAIDVLRAAADVADDPAVAVDLARAHLAADQPERAAALLRPYRVPVPRSDPELEVAATWLLAVSNAPGDHADDAGLSPDLRGTTPVRRRALVALALHRFTAQAPVDEVRPLLLESLGDLGPQSMFDNQRFFLLTMADLTDERDRLADADMQRARRTGESARYASAQLARATIANQSGRLRDAEALLRLGLEAPDVDGWWRFDLESWLCTTLSMQGRGEEAEALLEAIAARSDNEESVNIKQQLATRRAELAVDRGDYAAALEPARQAFDRLVGDNFSAIGCDLAVVLAAVGRADEAADVAREMLRRAERIQSPQALGIARATLGRIVGGEEGITLLEQAVDVLAGSSYRWSQANAEVALGAALRAAGRRNRAKQVLESALEYAVANDAAPIEEAARAELKLCGARPRRAARTGAAALTPSEERVARLAAEGRTNKEIAQHLFVTVKNVEMHLVHAYRKLEVSSRRDLAGVLDDPPAG